MNRYSPIRRCGISTLTREVQHKVLGRVEVVGQAIELSARPGRYSNRLPEPGEHTDDVLRSLGYSDQEIARLHEQKVVAKAADGSLSRPLPARIAGCRRRRRGGRSE